MRIITTTALALAAISAPALAAPASKTVVVKHIVQADGTVHEQSSETTGAVPSQQLKSLVDSCPDRKFETTATIDANGQKRETHIRLCGKKGESDAEWAATLKDAIKRIKGSPLADESKARIVAELTAEIGKLPGADAPK